MVSAPNDQKMKHEVHICQIVPGVVSFINGYLNRVKEIDHKYGHTCSMVSRCRQICSKNISLYWYDFWKMIIKFNGVNFNCTMSGMALLTHCNFEDFTPEKIDSTETTFTILS